jgi:ubiquitin-protein ligase
MNVHEVRLQAEYEAMQELRSQVATWEVIGSSNPPDTYRFSYHLRSIVGFEDDMPVYRDRHTVKVHLPPNYPRCPPTVRLVSKPYVLHPNIYISGRVCIEDRWKPVGMYLDTICELVGQLIAYQKMNLSSPANRDDTLFAWVERNRHDPDVIPTDSARIRLPQVKDAIVWGCEEAPSEPRIRW